MPSRHTEIPLGELFEWSDIISISSFTSCFVVDVLVVSKVTSIKFYGFYVVKKANL